MPVISRYKMYVGGVAFTKILKCSADGQFSVELPEFVAKVLHFNCVTGETRDKVEDGWEKALDRYLAAKTTNRKVICYQFFFVEASRCDFSFGSGLGMSVWANVFIETKITDEAREHFDYECVSEEDGNKIPPELFTHENFSEPMRDLRGESFERPEGSFGPRGHAVDGRRGVLDWTAEREQFFIDLIKGMRKMMDQVQKFTVDKETMLKLADSHNKLLEMGSPTP